MSAANLHVVHSDLDRLLQVKEVLSCPALRTLHPRSNPLTLTLNTHMKTQSLSQQNVMLQ